jgi:hypothetical protein
MNESVVGPESFMAHYYINLLDYNAKSTLGLDVAFGGRRSQAMMGGCTSWRSDVLP